MRKNVTQIIQNEIKQHGQVTAKAVAQKAKVSRQAAHKKLAILVKQKNLIKVGKTKGSYYIKYSTKKLKEAQQQPWLTVRRLKTRGLQEDFVFSKFETSTKTISTLPANTKKIFRYAFTEILNNAIEHSRSPLVTIRVLNLGNRVLFSIIDRGIGIFNNLRMKYKLKTNFDALRELLKGKITTSPKKHTGEGIFFTSKIADQFHIISSKIGLFINNERKDTLVVDTPNRKGTKVSFEIKINTRKSLAALFNEYTDKNYKFSKTKITLKLYKNGLDGSDCVSRSQARRLLFGLDKFKTIILDFDKIKGLGQSFADEVFRVFAAEHPNLSLVPINTCKAVLFMIKRAKARSLQ